jgi:ribonuclease-3
MTSRRPSPTILEAALGVGIEPALLERSLTHRSYAYENGGLPTNERLEFLGDAVLGLVVTTALYRNHPDLPEGQLAKLRASVVNMRALADVARNLGRKPGSANGAGYGTGAPASDGPASPVTGGLGPHLRLGKGEEATGGRDKSSILADTLEALLGAVYLDHGLDGAARVVHRLFDPVMADAAERGAGLDWKTSLQELTAEATLGVPEYRVTEEGPDHAKTFTATAVVAGEELGEGEGRSKKEAEQRAAEQAWRLLRRRSEVAAAADGVVLSDEVRAAETASPALAADAASEADAASGPGTGSGPGPDTGR